VASAVPLGLLGWATTRTVRAGLADAERDLQAAVLDRAASAIASELEFAGEATHRVGVTLNDASGASPEARVLASRDMLARASALLHIAVYVPDGQRVDTFSQRPREGQAPTPQLPPLDRIPENFLRQPPAEGRWLPAEFTSQGPILRYVEALGTAPERLWVVGTLRPEWLAGLVGRLSYERYGTRGLLLVVDERLRLLVPGPAPLGTSLARRDIFQRPEVLRGELPLAFSLTQEYMQDGVPMVGSLQAYRALGWFIAVRRPEREAYASLAAAQRVLGYGVLGSLAVALLLGALLAKRTTRFINALVRLTEDYARRRFEVRSAVATGDELQALGGALESMADNLQASEREIARRQKVESDLGRFLPREVAQAVAAGDRELRLGGERRRVTVLFADVVAFTGFAESASPEKVVAFLNELFEVLTEVVFRHGGMVDKFVGDCVMAVFGAGQDPRDGSPAEGDAPAARALLAAEDIQRFVEASAPAWKERYGLDVALGLGVHCGEALLGNLGSESRMEYTVIGDTVNVAARLESLARGGQTLVTAAVLREAGPGFSFNPLGGHTLRGKRGAIELFEVLS
jgi:class 3 adenylate cyclase